MLQCVCESSEQHPESPERLQFLLARLRDAGLLQDCLQVSSESKHQFPDGNADGKALTFGVAGVDDGELGAGGELSHGGAHTHVRHTAEYTRTGSMLMQLMHTYLCFALNKVYFMVLEIWC